MSSPQTVADIMTRKVMVLNEEDNLQRLDEGMERYRFRHLPVVDGVTNKLVGLLSQRDLARMSGNALLPARGNETVEQRVKERTFVADVMHRDPLTARPETTIRAAASMLRDHKVGCLPVVDEQGVLVGIVTDHDFLNIIADGISVT